jgi:hypothetical protein
MSFLRSSFIARCLGDGSYADQSARFNHENELPAQILRDRRSIERNAFQSLESLFPGPAFQAITLCVRL